MARSTDYAGIQRQHLYIHSLVLSRTFPNILAAAESVGLKRRNYFRRAPIAELRFLAKERFEAILRQHVKINQDTLSGLCKVKLSETRLQLLKKAAISQSKLV